jgi:hypothetical protein
MAAILLLAKQTARKVAHMLRISFGIFAAERQPVSADEVVAQGSAWKKRQQI